MDDLTRAMDVLRAAQLPDPVRYIVLDHAMPAGGPGFHIDDHDAQGQRYIQCTPAILDELRHIPRGEVHPAYLFSGIDVYRRESMPEGWPDA